MKNYIQPGKMLSAVAAAAVASGDVVVHGATVGVAAGAAALGEAYEYATVGVYDLPKTTSQVWSLGQALYWDAATGKVTSVFAGGLPLVGTAAAGALSAATTGAVRLGSVAVAMGPASFGFAAAAGGANVSEVTISPLDSGGDLLTGVRLLEIWLSDAATGIELTGTTTSGTVTAKSAEGTVFVTHTAKKHLTVQTKAAGTFVLEITDTAKTGFYVCVRDPATGAVHVSDQLVTGNYG